jgi:hypothetical protein
MTSTLPPEHLSEIDDAGSFPKDGHPSQPVLDRGHASPIGETERAFETTHKEETLAQPAAQAAVRPNSHDAAEPDVIPLDFSDVPSDEDGFIARRAVLGALQPTAGTKDYKECDLLQRIWRSGQDIAHPYEEIMGAEHPGYVKPRIKEIIGSLESIAILIQELDQYRNGVVSNLLHQYGLADCPILRNAEDISLTDSNRLLESFFLMHVQGLDDIIRQCRKHAQVLRYTDYGLLRGTDSFDRRFGPDRREWQAEFRSLVIFTERQASSLRQKMVERRRGFERVVNWRKKDLEKACSNFAIAKNVAKSTKSFLQ